MPRGDIVRAVAVAGSPVVEQHLRAVVDLDDRAFAAALREALDLRVLARADAAITMRHVLMGEAVYGDLLALERVQVHARWAATLSDAPAALVAHHWYEAGDDERAFDVGLIAAREATHAMAFDLAHRQYAQVLSLWDRVEAPAERAGEGRSDMALHAAETANWAGDPANAVAVVDEALAVVERAEREPREERDEAMASVLLERRAWYLLRQGANDAARKAYDAALAALPETADAATRARVLAGSVRAWERSAEYDRALTLAQEAVDVAVAGSVAAEIGPAQYMLGARPAGPRRHRRRDRRSSRARRPPPKTSSTRCCSRSRDSSSAMRTRARAASATRCPRRWRRRHDCAPAVTSNRTRCSQRLRPVHCCTVSDVPPKGACSQPRSSIRLVPR